MGTNRFAQFLLILATLSVIAGSTHMLAIRQRSATDKAIREAARDAFLSGWHRARADAGLESRYRVSVYFDDEEDWLAQDRIKEAMGRVSPLRAGIYDDYGTPGTVEPADPKAETARAERMVDRTRVGHARAQETADAAQVAGFGDDLRFDRCLTRTAKGRGLDPDDLAEVKRLGIDHVYVDTGTPRATPAKKAAAGH